MLFKDGGGQKISIGDKLYSSVFGWGLKPVYGAKGPFLDFSAKQYLISLKKTEVNKLLDADESEIIDTSHSDKFYLNKYTFYPLHVAVKIGNQKLLEKILKDGANVNAIMHCSITKEVTYTDWMAKRTSDESHDYTEKSDEYYTPLDIAENNSLSNIAKLLKSLGAKNYKDLKEKLSEEKSDNTKSFSV